MHPKSRRRYTAANREAWDEVAPIHKKLNHDQLLDGFATKGYNTLEAHCTERLSEIGLVGKSVAQLCCNNGRELLSVKNMGADYCVGFDASSEFIDQAGELANVAGHKDVEFVVTDIYDIDSSFFERFDIVMVTIGVLGWMPDLSAFLEIASKLLKGGGHMFIEETHPVLMMYEEGEGDAPSYLAYSYFHDEPWRETSGLDYYGRTKYESKPNYSFQHTLSDIFMAAIENGFVLKHFRELAYDISNFCSDLENTSATPP
ncbi:MAG: class I SAM-dependent methyltransferase, partial [Gammaproteobacteria bacterium]|nr:class I SAM-dependent methyltransferase [Gammaproteobacteria bacterium]